MIARIKTLPEPEVVSFDSSPVTPDETVICLQREIAYVDTLNPAVNVRYIGTKDMHDCITAYIYSETDHLIVHVDNYADLDLAPYISSFNYQHNIKISLVGGEAASATSIEKLKNIVSILYKSAEKLNIRVEVASQKLLEKNKYIEKARYQYAYNKILEKTDILCRQYYNGPLIQNELQGFTAQLFRHRNIAFTGEITAMVNLFGLAQDVYDPTVKESQLALELLPNLPIHYASRSAFLTAIKKVFSVQGYRAICVPYNDLFTQNTQLADFVFDINSNKIHVIDSVFFTPDEEHRSLSLFSNPPYRLSFDGRSGQWFKPSISNGYIERCKKATALVKNNQGSRAEIADILHSGHSIPAMINALIRNARNMLNDSCEKRPYQGYFFKSKVELEASYETELVTSRNLICLKDLSGIDFKAKVRLSPVGTVDAYCEFSLFSRAQSLKQSLQEKNITSHIATIKNLEGQDSYRLVVPAINAGQYAKAISSFKSNI